MGGFVISGGFSLTGGATLYDVAATPPAPAPATVSAIAIGIDASPFVVAYPWNSSTGFGAKYSDPGTAIINSLGIIGIVFSPSKAAVFMQRPGNGGGATASPRTTAYAWNSSTGFGTKYANQASELSGFATSGIDINKAGTFVAAAGSSAFSYYMWAWSDSTGWGTRYGGTLLTQNVNGITWNSSDTAILSGSGLYTPYVVAFQWSNSSPGLTTRYTDPSYNFSTDTSLDVAMHPNDTAVISATGGTGSPRVTAYPWSNSTGFGAKYSSPGTTPTGTSRSVCFSPSGDTVFLAHDTSPYVTAYPWDSSTGFGTKYSDPSTLPAGNGAGIAITPTGDAVAVAHATSPYVTAYAWSSSTGFGAKYTNPATLPAGNGKSIAFCK